jgi:hypothetical protein
MKMGSELKRQVTPEQFRATRDIFAAHREQRATARATAASVAVIAPTVAKPIAVVVPSMTATIAPTPTRWEVLKSVWVKVKAAILGLFD